MLTTNSNNSNISNSSNQSSSSPPILLSEKEEQQLQFYIHLVEDGSITLLDAHKLLLSGMASVKNEAKSWSAMFTDNILAVAGGNTIGNSNSNTNSNTNTKDNDMLPPECECYKRFVLCGYMPQPLQPNKCESELSGLEDLNDDDDDDIDDDIIATLCNAGLDLPTMNRMNAKNSTYTLDHHFQHQLGIHKSSQRTKIIQFVKEASVNVAFHQTASSNSNSNSKGSASSSSYSLSHHPKYAFDGNIKTRWESIHSDNQYLQVDLGERHVISRVGLAYRSLPFPIWRSPWVTLLFVSYRGQCGMIGRQDIEATHIHSQRFFQTHISAYVVHDSPWGCPLIPMHPNISPRNTLLTSH